MIANFQRSTFVSYSRIRTTIDACTANARSKQILVQGMITNLALLVVSGRCGHAECHSYPIAKYLPGTKQRARRRSPDLHLTRRLARTGSIRLIRLVRWRSVRCIDLLSWRLGVRDIALAIDMTHFGAVRYVVLLGLDSGFGYRRPVGRINLFCGAPLKIVSTVDGVSDHSRLRGKD